MTAAERYPVGAVFAHRLAPRTQIRVAAVDVPPLLPEPGPWYRIERVDGRPPAQPVVSHETLAALWTRVPAEAASA